jgi:diguanylate cyclase (GGDEF)-like protein
MADIERTDGFPADAVRALLRGLDQAIIACAPDGTITFAGGPLTALLGYEPAGFEGHNMLEFVRPTERGDLAEFLLRWSGRSGTPAMGVHDLLASDGSWVPMRYELMIGPEAGAFGEIVVTLSPADRPGRERHVLLERLLNEDRLVRLASAFLHHAVDAFERSLEDALAELSGLDWLTRVSVWTLEPAGASAGRAAILRRRALWTAKATAPRTPLPETMSLDENAVVRRLRDLEEVHIRSVEFLPDDWEDVRDWLQAAGVRSALAVPMTIGGEFLGFILAEVTRIEIEFSVTLVSTLRSAAPVFASAFRRHEAELELAQRARVDELTGLPNRWAFGGDLEQALEASQAAGAGGASAIAVAVINLDRFSMVNSALGHAAGDRLLVDAAKRMVRALGPRSRLARAQSDEFLVLHEGARSAEDAEAATLELLAPIKAPFEIDGSLVNLTASAGFALSDGATVSGAELVRRAEVAMRQARQLGGDRVEMDTEALRGKVLNRLQREVELRLAITRGEIEVHYQPDFDLVTGEVIGAEALARWNHPEEGLLTAEAFIPLAEECGVIGELGTQVVWAACATIAGWDLGPDHDSFLLKVNLSAHQLRTDVPGLVEEVLASTGLHPSRLCFELTESALLADPEGSVAILQAVRSQGVGLAIDDFGTGYSSMLYLKRLPVTLLKVDRSFVAGLPGDLRDRAIVRATVQLAASLAIDVTAEGVETEAQLEALLELGCTRGQGYLLGRPAPAADLFDRVTAGARRPGPSSA